MFFGVAQITQGLSDRVPPNYIDRYSPSQASAGGWVGGAGRAAEGGRREREDEREREVARGDQREARHIYRASVVLFPCLFSAEERICRAQSCTFELAVWADKYYALFTFSYSLSILRPPRL